MVKVHHWASPSRLGRLEACPGSYALTKDLPEETTPEAESGTRVHAAIAARLHGLACPEGLEDDEGELVERCLDWFAESFPGVEQILVEQSMSLDLGGDTIEEYGTADVVVLDCNSVTIIDWKTGRAEPSERDLSLQVSAYALCAMQRYKVAVVNVLVYMPRLDREYQGLRYRDDSMEDDIAAIMEAAQQPDAPRVPGPSQCRYCPGRAHCPEALAQAMAIVPSKPEIRLPVDPAGRGRLLRDIDHAMTILEIVAGRIKADHLEGLCEAEGYRVVTRAATPKIKDVRQAFALLNNASLISVSDFLDQCEVKLSKLSGVLDKKKLLKILAPVIDQAPDIRYLMATTKKEKA